MSKSVIEGPPERGIDHRSNQMTGQRMIVPTLCVGMHLWTLCVRFWGAERPGLHSHAERGNDQAGGRGL
ncbi:hypothetical protein FQ192_06520 [Pseudomonas sp. ANT_J12]|nr:hypothetical protein FQ192_06520 [Pseudomonas sp. ANT_J12]